MEMQKLIAGYDAVRRAFAMMALAMVCNTPRKKLATNIVECGMRVVPLPIGVRDKLRDRVARGDVTCIVPEPEPFVWIVIQSAHEEFRAIYGVWVGRPASWRGTVDPAKLPRIVAGTDAPLLSASQAEAMGIPLPSGKA